jgi:hypothetical protein
MNMIDTRCSDPVFRDGDQVVLAKGTYQGTRGVFVRLNDSIDWATITERNGAVRSHPVVWLAHAAAANNPHAV